AVPPPSLVARHPSWAPKPPTVLAKRPSSQPSGDESQVIAPVEEPAELLLPPPRRWLWVAALLAPVAGGAVGAFLWQRSKTPEPIVLVAPLEPAPAPPRQPT